jgi:hypothetical protein
MRSACVVQVHVTVNNITVLSFKQGWFYGEFMSPPTKNLRFHVKFSIFLSDFNLIWIFLTEFYKAPNTKFHGNACVGSRADTYDQADGHIARRT